MSKSMQSSNSKDGEDKPSTPIDERDESVADSRAAQPQQGPPSRQCAYLDRVATISNVFSDGECEQIINTALNDWDERESMMQRNEGGRIEQNFIENLDYRNTTLFVPTELDEWLFSKILDAVMIFNNDKDGYGFELAGMAEPPNVMRYQAPDINNNEKPGKYDWHLDIGPGSIPSMRKLSYSILLNPGEYAGGELAFMVGGNTDPHPGQRVCKSFQISKPQSPDPLDYTKCFVQASFATFV